MSHDVVMCDVDTATASLLEEMRSHDQSRMTSRPHRLKKTSSMQSKRRDLHHTGLHRETNEKLNFYC